MSLVRRLSTLTGMLPALRCSSWQTLPTGSVAVPTSFQVCKRGLTGSAGSPSTNGRSVAADEIERFEQVQGDWWEEEGGFAILRQLAYLRTDILREAGGKYFDCDLELTKPLAGLRIADVGCGGGLLAESVARIGAHVDGIDMSPGALKAATEHLKTQKDVENRVNYHYTTVEEHGDTHAKQYDIVVASEIIEHVEGPEDFVKACGKLVKPGGLLFFTTINRTPKAYVFTIFAAENLLGWVPKGTHTFAKYVTPQELASWIEGAATDVAGSSEFEVVELTGLHYNLLSSAWYTNEDDSINYAMVAQRKL
eukprot:Clim_evm105s128 gene=Clim_evmTU105s128